MPTFGVVIETAGFIDRYDGYANLKALADIRKKLTRTEIEQVMQKLGLDPRDRKKVKHYSLGMRQRLAIAQAIMEDPPVLLLDEPLNGLDYEGVKTVYQIIKEQRSRGKVILVASHHEEDIRLLCDKVLWLNQATLSPIEDINAYTMYDVKGRELA